MKDQIQARLLERVEEDAGTGCWIYTGAWSADGVAWIRVGDRPYAVARVSAWLYFEHPCFQLLGTEIAVHKPGLCRNGACFNPKHIARCANRSEMFGIIRDGGIETRRKLTRELAAVIRERATTMSRTQICECYRLSHVAARSLLQSDSWKGATQVLGGRTAESDQGLTMTV